ncbi:MAG TPA: hypothetical protein VFK04_18160 [Gemmatimonadaceae bacterium]|nr:hypothetical protein [Gemmatimonadaceae bacterium]
MKLHRSGDRRGFALLVALAALVIIGGLVVGAFFASTQEFRIGRNTVLQSRALTAAEYGLNSALSDSVWQQAWNNRVDTGAVLTPVGGEVLDPGDGSSDVLTVTVLGGGNFLVVSEGFSGSTLGAQGRKRLGGLFRMRKPEFNFRGAVTTKGSMMIAGTSEIHGEDTSPGWSDCPPSPGNMPGIAYNPTTPPDIKCSGCVSGNPMTQADTAAANSSTYNVFGDLTYNELAAFATKTFPGGTTFTNLAPMWKTDADGNKYCDRTYSSNWGDPTHLYPDPSCQSYFPIIHVTGNLKLTGGAGQGILLVDGDLDASGGVNFFGPVIVRGTFSVTGNGDGARFVGGLMAENVNLNQSKMAGNAVVSYSTCAITSAINGSAKPMFDGTRGWIEMY